MWQEMGQRKWQMEIHGPICEEKVMKKCLTCVFYILADFTTDEKAKKNVLYVAVKNGRKICKQCGNENHL